MIKFDNLGQTYTDSNHLCDLLYKNPELDIAKFRVTDSSVYNASCKHYFLDWELIKQYHPLDINQEDFDLANQNNWKMPVEYKQLDIAEWVLSQCTNQAELQRTGEELLLFQDRNLFDLLRYLKYLVDTMRKNNVVWGVGRGSSVASFVLYKIGVHRINSLTYDLDPAEFLK